MTEKLLSVIFVLCVGSAQAQTPGTIPVWQGGSILGDSVIIQHPSGSIGIGTTSPGANSLAVMATGNVAINGTVTAPTGDFTGVWGQTDSTGNQTAGVLGVATAASGTTTGVWGRSASASYGATGVLGEATSSGQNNWGVRGRSSSTIGGAGVLGEGGDGVAGRSTRPGGNGVFGEANDGVNPWGIWGRTDSTSPDAYAGYFEGRVRATGGFFTGAGASEIDHPLDPGDRYLVHAFMASPEMMNVYSGNIILDRNGESWIELPDYFDTVNRDARYQLTGIGNFAPIYVAERITNNRFKIAAGQPGMEVSWQVTGIRKDPYAEKHPLVVEREKSAHTKGYYLHPDL